MSDSDHRQVGSRFGIDFIVPQAYSREWKTNSGLLVQTSNCNDLLSHEVGGLDARHLVCLISSLSAGRLTRYEEFKDVCERANLHQAGVLRDWQFIDILRRLLSTERKDWSGLTASLPKLIDLSQMVSYSLCEGDRPERAAKSTNAMLFRMMFRQNWDQDDYRPGWFRGLYITSKMLPAHSDPKLNVGDKLESLLGLPFDEFLFLGFGLYAVTTQQPGKVFNPKSFMNSTDFDLPPEHIEAFFERVAIDFDTFGSNAKHPQVYMADFDAYALSPLLRWPAIIFPDGEYSVPIPRLLLSRLTTGIYYDLLQGLDQKDRGRFGHAWGAAFEQYVGRLLGGLPGTDWMQGQIEYALGQATRSTCDWLLKCGKTALLIECKTRGVSPRAKMTGFEQDIREAVLHGESDGRGSSLAGGLVQLMRTCQAVRDGATKLGHLHDSEALLPVLVTLDSMYQANKPDYFQRILAEEAIRLDPNVEALLNNTPFQVTDVAGLERLCQASLLHKTSPGALVAAKVNDPKRAESDFQTDFPQLSPDKALPQLPLLSGPVDSLFDQLVETFRRS